MNWIGSSARTSVLHGTRWSFRAMRATSSTWVAAAAAGDSQPGGGVKDASVTDLHV